MKAPDLSDFSIGPRLSLTFAALMLLILGGNGLLVWQFRVAGVQTDRLTGVSQQLIEVQRLRESLQIFHQRLDDVAQSQDARRLAAEAEPLRSALLEQTQRTRAAVTSLPPDAPVDPAFLPTLEAIEITLPSQLESITALANANDWGAVHLRVAKELKPLETQTSALVQSIDQEVSGELTQAVANMRVVQLRILLIVPITAVSTFLTAAFFGWAMTRRIIELRLEERINERTRIARELHDTLLQGFVSAAMHLDMAVDQLPDDSSAKPSFLRVQQLMAQMIQEGHNVIRGFRSSDRDTQDLGQAFSRVPQELGVTGPIDFRVIVQGHPRPLRPVIRDDVYSIGREALVNAFRHARASRIEVELEYSATELRVLVRDDGCGLDAKVLQFPRQGRWGLSGMRERADSIGAKLKALSRDRAGTEVELRVPARIAFESQPASHSSKWFAGRAWRKS